MWKAVALVIVLSLSVPLVLPAGTDSAAAKPPPPPAFSSPVMVNDNQANIQAVPIVVSMPWDQIFVAWRDSRSGDDDIYTSSSRDKAASFSVNRRADDAATLSAQKEPAAAVAEDGTVLLVWQDNRRCRFDYDVFFTRSSDGGDTFSSNVKVDDSETGVVSWQEHPSITVTSDGTIFIAWTDDRTGTLRIRGAYSTDGGSTFSPSAEIVADGASGGQTGVVLASDGERIYATFTDNVTGTPHPYLCISVDGGRTFGDPIRLDGSGSGVGLQTSLSIATMPRGGIVAAWQDLRSGSWDIYASIVRADGTIVVSDMRVDDDTTGESQEDPCIAVDRMGVVYAVWEDERDLAYAIRFAYLKVGSTKFTTSLEVAMPGNDDMQRRAAVVCPEPGDVYVVWQDDRAGSYDVYASYGHFTNLFDLELVNGWNFVSVPIVGAGYRASTLGLMTGDMVVGWNSATATYDRMYVVGVSPLALDFALDPDEGYWIYANAAQTLNLNGVTPETAQARTIAAPSGGGWAFVGFASLRTDMRASDIPGMYTAADSILLVSTYDSAVGQHKSYVCGAPSTDFALVPGQGYMLWCSTSGALIYDP